MENGEKEQNQRTEGRTKILLNYSVKKREGGKKRA